MLPGFGEVKSVRRQKYIGSPEIETGTRLVLMTFKTIPPRVININGFFVGSGIRANPWSAIYATLRGTKLQSVRTRTNVDCVGRSGILPVHVQTLGAPLF